MTAVSDHSFGRRLVILIPVAWLVVFVLLPFVVLLATGFADAGRLGGEPLLALVKSLGIAAFTTLVVLAAGYPIAYTLARLPRRWRKLVLALTMLPLGVSLLVRTYAWMAVLQGGGPLDRLLMALHVVQAPSGSIGTDAALSVGIVYAYLPLTVLPLYVALARLDPALGEAAADLGCRPWRTFWRVTLPLSAPGVLAGALLCFIPVAGTFVVPELVGDAQAGMAGPAIWRALFGRNDWGLAAALAAGLACLLVAPAIAFGLQAMRAAEGER
jgi:putrescine transport system permease protein